MNILKFHKIVDELMFTIEDKLDNYCSNIDIDYEIQYHTMTITFYNKNKIIINRQESLKQIWLATKQNGYHFKYKKKEWICDKYKDNIWNILTNTFLIETNELIIFQKNI
ncbi:iron donor protein CyaY [Buchnera aphidicola]|uniref:iron donor protein CyaY n=1 Tax=Buchnera aphidicola TaxID=9 RepID=UPI0034642F54